MMDFLIILLFVALSCWLISRASKFRSGRFPRTRKSLSWSRFLHANSGVFTSPTGSTVDLSSANFLAAPNGVTASYTPNNTPDIWILVIPAGANFNSTTSPVQLTFVPNGLLLKIQNKQASAIKIVGSRVGDPGAVLGPSAIGYVGSDENGGVILIAVGGSGAGGEECA